MPNAKITNQSLFLEPWELHAISAFSPPPLQLSQTTYSGIFPKRPLQVLGRMCGLTHTTVGMTPSTSKGILEFEGLLPQTKKSWFLKFKFQVLEHISEIFLTETETHYVAFCTFECSRALTFISPIPNPSPSPLGNHQPTIKGGWKVAKLLYLWN